ncbi:MAG: alpha-hydroxy-acid oxidizing protein [Bacteroidota bacterium]
MSQETQASQSVGVQHQMQIYLNGVSQQKPEFPIAYEELLAKAREVMTPEAFAYIAGGAGGEETMKHNREAFHKWQIIPRMLVDVSQRSIGVELFGKKYPTPLLFAPVGVLSIAHEEAEVAVARAAKALHIPQILSTVSSKSLEEVAEANGDNPRWFQLYWGADHDFTRSILTRAEKAGYEAIVVTLDTRMLAWRERDIKLAYLPFLYGEGLSNYFSDSVFRSRVGDPEKNKMQAIMHFANAFSDASLTWDDLKVIREHTKLPLILKGIQSLEDAQKSIDYGADGIVVSNHGGRQVDGAIGSLDVLKEISDAVGKKTTILFDSGIRRGADVFKAMALGAKAVLVARPYALALGVGGEKAVKHVMANLVADTDLTLGLVGANSWEEVNEHMLRRF